MPKKVTKPTPRKAASRLPDKVPEARRGFKIAEFCARNGGMSKGSYYNMKAKGLGPREMRPTGMASGVVLISEEAEIEWRIKMEKLAKAVEAEGIAKREAQRIERAERKSATKHGEA